MSGFLIGACVILAGWVGFVRLARLLLAIAKGRKKELFGYFEYRYNGKVGSSRDYGPMRELDMIGAMEYRKECGAEIIFQVYRPTRDEIDDIIDHRYYMQQQLIDDSIPVHRKSPHKP